ncbi:MAG: hypothetical protein IT318_25680 [Anaerolineales bacterium]|nr:hypothetical protein [Anaerolineales bacterium]
MRLDLEAAPATLLAPVIADARPITTGAELEDVIVVLAEVWSRDFSWVRERLGGHQEVPGYVNIYGA